MISVILYGRNDSHGYNLHKRAAISLNCIAEVLSDPDDEILFVDYNTPNDLPTFVEAIYDTLTEAVKSRLRVFRVRPEVHQRLAGSTHLAALEPHSRNIAIRRSNPRNRWVLLTNTDMIFLPRASYTTLSGAVGDLADGLYIVPRYELPEPLWEAFPRTDPQSVLRACEDLGRELHLEEITLSLPEMRFDQPGDFQLVPRQALWDINGFDERMIHGWHADANICKRFFLFYGNRTESLADRVKGFHCDHTRVATLAHRLDIKLENNLNQFFFDLKDPVAHHQAETWGAPGEEIEELNFQDDPPARYVSALRGVIGPAQPAEYVADSNDLRNFVAYHAEHVLPHLCGCLTTYPRAARIAYIGANPHMRGLSTRAIAGLGFSEPLFDAGVAAAPETLLAGYDLLLFDFGLDPAAQPLDTVARVTDWPRELRYRLGDAAKLLEACALLAGQNGSRSPDFLTINANHHIFRQFAGQFLLMPETPYATHVRKGRPRVGEERLYRGHTWKYVEDDMRSFFGYGKWENTIPRITAGDSIDFTSTGQSSRCKDGNWGAMDFTGTWIEGHRASILFAPPEHIDDDWIAFVGVNEAFVGPEDEPIRVQVFFEGEPMVRWTLFTRYGITVCKVLLPARLLVGRPTCRIELNVENPSSAQLVADAMGQKTVGQDPRELGIKVQQITFTNKDPWRYSLGETLDFTERGRGIEHADECWTQPDEFGAWTLGSEAGITLWPRETTTVPVAATFTINDAVIDPDHPDMEVSVTVNGERAAVWTDWHLRNTDARTVLLPAECFRTLEPIRIALHVKNPRTSFALGWSTWDKRPRGIRLNNLRIAPILQYHLGDVMDFTSGGESVPFAGNSIGVEWSAPDAWGFWTIGHSASIVVPLDQPLTETVPMALVISDCMVNAAAAKLPVSVKANGRTVAEWVLDNRKPHTRSFMLPAEAVAAAPKLTLTFEIPDPRSPVSFGWGPDPNPLGLRIARAVIGKSQIEIPDFEKHIRYRTLKRIPGVPQLAALVVRMVARYR
uniref:Uncharacterized protein n=1 Tax=Solibacter usitatus (strain Ellin6076) TaxID=234267 RepID=Q02BJ9_SOLUE